MVVLLHRIWQACKWIDKKEICWQLDWGSEKSRSCTSCVILDVINVLRLVIGKNLNLQARCFETRGEKVLLYLINTPYCLIMIITLSLFALNDCL